MTTNVIVTAHSWPVRIEAIDTTADGETRSLVKEIEPHGHAASFVTSSRQLLVTELPLPKPEAA